MDKIKREKILRKYVILDGTLKTSLWMIIGIIILWSLLLMIDFKFFLLDGAPSFSLLLTVIFCIFFVIYTIYAFIKIKKGPNDPDWQMIEKEVNTVFLDRYIDDDDEVSLIDIHKAKKRADQSDKRFMDKVYDAIALYDIKMPDIKRYVLSLILVPSIILVISYIPEYIGDYSIKNQSVDKAASVIYTLEDAFKDDSYSIYYDDPNDEYLSYGYYFSAYMDYDMDSYITFSVTNEGDIEYMAYSIDVDPNEGIDTNIAYIEDKLAAYYANVKDLDIDERFLQGPELSDTFKEEMRDLTIEDEVVDMSTGPMYMSYHIYDYGYGPSANFYLSINNY